MATPDEREILSIIDEEGKDGACHEVKIAKCMGLRIDYLRSILGSMGRRDFIDVFASGKIELVEKGWKALGKTPPSPYASYGGMAVPSGPPEPPEERYERWLTGKKSPSQKKKEEEEKKRKEEGELDGPTLLKKFSSKSEELKKLSPEQKLMKWTGQ